MEWNETNVECGLLKVGVEMENNQELPNCIHLGMGEGVVAKEPCFISSVGIGSCVVVTFYDTQQCIGGMAHIMLPEAKKTVNSKQYLIPMYEVNILTPSPTLPDGRQAGPPLKGGAILKSPLERDAGMCNPSPFDSSLFTLHYSLSCQYADTAVASILKEMLGAGALLENIVAKMAGGAKMFDHEEPDKENIGMENVRSVRKLLRKEKITLIGEDIGGSHGRSVDFYLDSGRLIISALDMEDREI